MTQDRTPAELRVLLLAPTVRDGQVSRQILASEGIQCEVCKGLKDLQAEMAAGAAVIVLPEEVVLADTAATLRQSLRLQPAWSDLPVIVLSRAGTQSPAADRALFTLGNVSLVERPSRVSTLVSQIRSALRAREHQYQVRDLLADERAARIEADVANRNGVKLESSALVVNSSRPDSNRVTRIRIWCARSQSEWTRSRTSRSILTGGRT